MYWLYGPGFVGVDGMYSLAWGRDIAHGLMPRYAPGPTPHPLSNFVGVLLAPLGAGADHALLLITYGALAMVFYAAWELTRQAAGPLGAATAVLLVATRGVVTVNTAQAYLDIPYTAIVLGAVGLELGTPRRGTPVFALLFVAGLLRPEAWFIAGLYWLWTLPAASWRRRIATAAVVAAAPAIWMLSDLVVTGDALYSLTGTTSAAANVTGTDRGLHGVLFSPYSIVEVVRRPVAAAAFAGCLLLLLLRRAQAVRLLLATAAVTVAFLIPVAGGTLLIARYMLPAIVLLCVFAGAGAGQLAVSAVRLRLVGAVCAVLVLASVASELPRLRDTSRGLGAIAKTRDAARRVAGARLPCRPIVVPNGRLSAPVAVWRQIPLEEVRDASRSGVGTGTYLFGTPEALEGLVAVSSRDHGRALATPSPAASVTDRDSGWALYADCAS